MEVVVWMGWPTLRAASIGSETSQPGVSSPGVVGAVEGTLEVTEENPWEK